MRDRWTALWTRLTASLIPNPSVAAKADLETAFDTVFNELIAAYQEPHRHYHTLAHLQDCLEKLDAAKPAAAVENADEIELALWFHDAIYNTHQAPMPQASTPQVRADNEALSALWMKRVATAAGLQQSGSSGEGANIARIESLILATRHAALPVSDSEQLLVDIDLSVLGADERAFAAYEKNIRLEYLWVEESLFRAKRAEILQQFLDREPLYHTPFFHDRYEARAKQNLAASIRKLHT